MYPQQLIPNIEIEFEINGKLIKIPKCTILFEKWPVQYEKKKTFGGKPVICRNNKPMFAEEAIMKLFVADGWNARWISTYGKSKLSPVFLDEWKDLDKWEDNSYKNQIHAPIADEAIAKILFDIAMNNPKHYAGCWDIFAWKKEKILFAESKRKSKDQIRSTQLNWLAAALQCELKPDNFLMVEWDFDYSIIN